jgi:Nitrile hydratase, alpha chain
MMETETPTRRDLETALIEKCWKDPEFKKQVISDPKGMLEHHIGQKLPAPIKIFIHQEDANTLHFSIPPAPANLTELSEDDLERVAGGTDIGITVIVASAIVGAGITAEAAVTKIQGGW